MLNMQTVRTGIKQYGDHSYDEGRKFTVAVKQRPIEVLQQLCCWLGVLPLAKRFYI